MPSISRNSRFIIRTKIILGCMAILAIAYVVDTFFDFLRVYEEQINPVTEIHSYVYAPRHVPSVKSMLLDHCIQGYTEGAPRYWCREMVEGIFQ